MSRENLAKFMQQVQLDPSLQQKLAAAPDKEQASRLAVELGREMGLEFNEAQVLVDLDYGGELDESELEAVAGGHNNLPRL
jgi:predicted ribosomally synthesized peptide with nif11-like leader